MNLAKNFLAVSIEFLVGSNSNIMGCSIDGRHLPSSKQTRRP